MAMAPCRGLVRVTWKAAKHFVKPKLEVSVERNTAYFSTRLEGHAALGTINFEENLGT